MRVALTFVVVLITWVFFRAADLPAAVRYLGVDVRPRRCRRTARSCSPESSISRITCSRSVAAAIVTWTCPQTWDWTRTLTAPKAVAVAAAFVAAAVMLTTQAFNPFIYFIF